MRGGSGRRLLVVLVGLLAIVVGAAALQAGTPAQAVDSSEVRILVSPPSTLDPAAQGDIDSAVVTAQLYETLTAFDASLHLQPALAAGWDVAADGREVTFHLRPNLAFSDGSPLTAQDVVGSWLRIIDPTSPSPLAALILDVKGAADHLAGRDANPGDVGLRAQGNDVVVDLERPGSDFPTIVSGPLFAVVPPSVWRDGDARFGPGAVTSGGYSIESASEQELTLQANGHYWAGRPAIGTVHLLLDIGGRSPVAAFDVGDVDYTNVSVLDAAWLPYDRTFGPQLRATPSLALTYLGLDTRVPPFNDVRVRQAFGEAVDWARVVPLAAFAGETPAVSMVPPAIPGSGNGNWLPKHDPADARRLLAEAGYPGGKTLPDIHFGTGGASVAQGIAADLERELGMHVELETYDDELNRIQDHPPNIWITGWIADYPGPNDFLGVILGSGSHDNYGGWSDPAFDQAVADALASRDASTSQAAFQRALAEVQREVPVVPLYLGIDYALSRDGLLGAGQNGLGIPRIAGMAWAP